MDFDLVKELGAEEEPAGERLRGYPETSVALSSQFTA